MKFDKAIKIFPLNVIGNSIHDAATSVYEIED